MNWTVTISPYRDNGYKWICRCGGGGWGLTELTARQDWAAHVVVKHQPNTQWLPTRDLAPPQNTKDNMIRRLTESS